MISMTEAAAMGVEHLRKPKWANPCDYLKIDIIDGEPGPWAHLHAPQNESLHGCDPVESLAIGATNAQDWVPHEGPLIGSKEYKESKAFFAELERE